MDWKDVIPVLAGGLVILVVALVVKPALLGEPIGSVSPGPVPTPAPPAYVPPTPAPTATPFPEEGEVYTRTFRWTAIDGGVHTTQVRVPEALFLEHRATPRFADALAWGRYALADADRPFLADLAGRIAPPTANLVDIDPQCDLDYVPLEARPMQIRAALSNSFGFGGTNGTLIFKRI